MVGVWLFCVLDFEYVNEVIGVVWHPVYIRWLGLEGGVLPPTPTWPTHELCAVVTIFPLLFCNKGLLVIFWTLETSVSTIVGHFWVIELPWFVMLSRHGPFHIIFMKWIVHFLMYSTKHLTSVTLIIYTCTVYVYTSKITSNESQLLIALLILAIESHLLLQLRSF